MYYVIVEIGLWPQVCALEKEPADNNNDNDFNGNDCKE